MNTLQNGSTGGEVVMLQRALSVLGYDISIDGNYGPGTTTVVTQFQTANNLGADGAAGSDTWDAIDSQAPQGMDISHQNGAINWPDLTPHIQFVYCKCSEGANFVDPEFAGYISAIKQKSLMAGAYHFLTFQSSAQDQANNFLTASKQLDFSTKDSVLPPMLDIEWQVVGDDGTDANPLNQYIKHNKETCVQIITDWLRIVSAQTGRTPVIYTAKNFWNQYFGDVTQFGDYPLWIAAYQPQPPGMPDGWEKYSIWQYAESGDLPGTSGDVDQDIFSGTLADLKAMA